MTRRNHSRREGTTMNDDTVSKYVASVEPTSALFVAGQWTSTRATFAVEDPATGAVIASVSDATAAEAVTAVDAAHDAFDGWRRTPPRERSEMLRRAHELMLADADRLVTL